MRKKAQIQGQVFVYVLTLIITGAILIFGYNSVRDLIKNSDQAEMVNFQKNLKSDFEKMSSDYGSSETETYNVPSRIKKICFYQKGDDNNLNSMPDNLNPLIIDSIKDETGNNVFLVFNDDAIESMKLPRIEVSEGQIFCINTTNNKLELRLEGLGNGVLVEQEYSLQSVSEPKSKPKTTPEPESKPPPKSEPKSKPKTTPEPESKPPPGSGKEPGSYCTSSPEICDDLIDNDCDELIDCEDSNCSGDPACPTCVDTDEDHYYVESSGCDNEIGFLGHNDCDDAISSIYPGADEICDERDNDCDGETDENLDCPEDKSPYDTCLGDCYCDAFLSCNAGYERKSTECTKNIVWNLIPVSGTCCCKEEPHEQENYVYPQTWATGDGTKSNPWANDCLNKALSAVPAGGTIYLRAGYYLLSNTLDAETKSFNLIGEGMNKSIIVTGMTDTNGMYIETDYCTLKGFTIDGASQTDGIASLINIQHCDYALLEDIEAKNAGTVGINLFAVNHASLQNIYAHDNYAHGIHPGAFGVTGRNMYNTYQDIYAWNNRRNGFDDWGNNINLEQYNVFDNLQCWDNGELGIAIANQKSGVLSNSFASGNGEHGIWLSAIENFSINDCSVIGTVDSQGIVMGNSKNVTFLDVIVKNNHGGIALSDCSDVTFNTCQSYDDRDPPLQQYGIELYGTNTGISLLYCILSPNKNGGIYNPNKSDYTITSYVYPQQWATGDGTESNPWANDCIKKAYDNTPEGGTIYLRAGYYQLAGYIDISKQINIIGEGMNKTIIKTANTYGFTVIHDHCTFKGFTMDGGAQTAGDLPIINVNGNWANSDYIVCEDIEVKNGISTGIQPFEANYGLYKNIYAHNNGEHGMHPCSNTEGEGKYNTYQNIYAWNNRDSGFDDRGIGTTTERTNNIYDNLQCWDNDNHGIALTYQSGIVLSNSGASGNGVSGIYLKYIEDSTINNSSVFLSGSHGLMITLGVKNTNFTNVIVKNNGNGIQIYDTKNLVFTSCQSYDDRTPMLQSYGIAFGGTASTGISIVNSKLTPNKNGEIYNPNNSEYSITSSYIYPQDFGATGDGTESNPWANDCLNKALDAVPAGGTIYLRSGYYALSKTLIPNKKINIIGEGINKTIIVTTMTNTNAIYFDGVNDITLKGFTLDCDSQSPGGYSGINFHNCDYITLEDIEVKNAGFYGINPYQVSHSLFKNIYTHDNYRHGLHPGSDKAGRNMYNKYQDIYAWNNGVSGFDDRGSTIEPIEQMNNVYDNLQCWDNGEHGIAIGLQKNGVLSNSFASGNGRYGIYLYDTEDFNVNDCSTALNLLGGLIIARSKNDDFTNVIVKNNGIIDIGKCGITIKDSTNTIFNSCQSYDDRTPMLQSYGLYAQGTTDYIELNDCVLTPNRLGEIYNEAGAIIIWGNCVDTDGDGYGAPASSNCANSQLDCNDNNKYVNPGATEDCDNNIDDDCDGLKDCSDTECSSNPACVSGKWSGLGMGTYGGWDSYVSTILANGFTKLRIDIPSYENTAWLGSSKTAVISAVGKGANVIWGVSTGTTLTSSNWAAYRTAVLSAAQWAQDHGVYEFQLGNELEGTIDGTTLKVPQLITNLKSLATEVQGIFTNGDVSYTCLQSFIDEWVTAGKGNMDILASNVYMTWDYDKKPVLWKNEIDALVGKFGTEGTYLTEFSINTKGVQYYSEDEAVQAAALTEMIDYIKASGMTRAIYYVWKDDGEYHFGVVKADGTYRKLWDSLINSN